MHNHFQKGFKFVNQFTIQCFILIVIEILVLLHLPGRQSFSVLYFCSFFLSYQMTPLHVAAEKGRYRTVEELIDLGAEISTEDNDEVGILYHN